MHDNPAVEYLSGGPPRLTMVLVHGRTLDPAYMQALAERIALDGIRYVFPAADGNSWYPRSFLAPLEENEPALSAAIACYERIVSGLLAAGTDPLRLVLGGFSQGACLTAEYLHRHPRPLGGAVLWTGGLIGPEGTEWTPRPTLAGMPAYITTSRTDPFVPPSRVTETIGWLGASGVAVQSAIFDAREHEVSNVEIAAARRMCTTLIGGTG